MDNSSLYLLLGVVLLVGFMGGGGIGFLLYRRALKRAEETRALPAPRAGAALTPKVSTPGEEREVDVSTAAARDVISPPPDAAAEEKKGFFGRLVAGLSRTQSQLVERFDAALKGRKEIDQGLYDDLEGVLLSADVGIKTTQGLLERIKSRASRDQLKEPSALRGLLQEEMLAVLRQGDPHIRVEQTSPFVILIIGVNGVGKTTTIGKLASRYTRAGKKVVLAAGDTFRAAATEQLEIWAERSGAEIVKAKEGADPSAVVFDAITAARARGADVVIADTAGRLHTKTNLMEELKKVTRVAGKALPGAPHETLLVLDSTMGQNALSQARIFHEGCSLTGLILTKLDGTAKGGVAIGIVDELKLPVKYIGVGEKVDDFQPFDPEQFVKALF